MTDDRLDRLQAVTGSVSRETFDALLLYETLFRRWNQSINMASRHTMESFWDRHVLDSAQLLKLAPSAADWLDLGSGGGLPGAVIAILLRDHPGRTMSMVESNGKKASFLRTVIRETAAPASIHCQRIEQYQPAAFPDVITARAVAALGDLLGLSQRWIAGGSTALFHKGRDYRSEIEQIDDLSAYHLLRHQSVVDPASVILEIRIASGSA